MRPAQDSLTKASLSDTRFTMKMLKKMQVENIKSVCVSDKAAADFNEHASLYLKRTAWAGNVRLLLLQIDEDLDSDNTNVVLELVQARARRDSGHVPRKPRAHYGDAQQPPF